MGNGLDGFRAALQLSVEGDPVTLSVKGADGAAYEIKPRKFSKKHAAKIRKLMTDRAGDFDPSLIAKIARLQRESGGELNEDVLRENLSDEDIAAMMRGQDPEDLLEIEKRRITYGIAEHNFGGEWAMMTEEVAEIILENPAVAEEVLAAVDALNPTFGDQTSS